MNPNTTEENTNLPDILRILSRYRWRFVLATFGVMTGLLVGSFLLPRNYKAEAIFERRTDMVLTEIAGKGASTSFWDSHRSSLAQEIAGQLAVEQMIETLKASDKYAHLIQDKTIFELNDLRTEVARRVKVSFDISTPQFDRIRVGLIHSNPPLATAVVNTLVRNYMARTRRLIDGRLRETAAFFQSEVDRNRQKSEIHENQKLSFELEYAELLPEFPGSVQMRLTGTQRELANAQQNYDEISMRVTALRELIESTPAIVPQVITTRNPLLTELENQLNALQKKEKVFLSERKMKDKHPDLIGIKDRIASIKTQIANTAEEVVTQKHLSTNRQRQDLEVQLTNALTSLQASEKRAESLKEQLSQLGLQSTQLFPVRTDYRKLSRQIEKAQRRQAFWEDNLRRVQIALTAEAGHRGISLTLIKPSSISRKPVSPSLMQVLIAAVTLGIAAGSINVFMAFRSDNSFMNGEELTNTCNLPLLGAVSEIISKQQQKVRKFRNLVIYPLNATAMAAVLITVTSLLYINLEKPLLYRRFMGNSPRSMQNASQSLAAPATVGQE